MVKALEAALRMQTARDRRPRPARPRKLPRPRYPTLERLYYYRQLAHLVDLTNYIVRRDLLPRLGTLLGGLTVQAQAPLERTDAADLDAAFAEIERAIGAEIPDAQIEVLAQTTAVRVARWSGNALTKQVQEVAKVNLYDDSSGLAQHLELFVAENVALVRSLGTQHLTDIKGIVSRGARAGLHHSEVAAEIVARFDMPKRRAALIASDQVGKLNGELNQLRQQNLGVRRYRWSSSQDERVRPRHRALNGEIQDWSRPPIVDERSGRRGHPGQDIRCRCSAIPIIDDVLADAGLIDPADVEFTQPRRGEQPPMRAVVVPPGPRPPTPPPAPPPVVPPPAGVIAPPPELPMPSVAERKLVEAAAQRERDEAARAKRREADVRRRERARAERERLERDRLERERVAAERAERERAARERKTLARVEAQLRSLNSGRAALALRGRTERAALARSSSALARLTRGDVPDAELAYLREGMRDLTVHRGAYAGATPAEATAIATGKAPARNSGRYLEPIAISTEPGHVELVDGRHRMQAAREAGATHILATITDPRGRKRTRIIPIPR